jgi:beta-barrel assembly-enhancing protease
VTQVWHYDGVTGLRHEATLVEDASGFTLAGAGLDLRHYDWADLVYRGEKKEGPFYGLKDDAGWQIGLTDPVPDTLFARLPKPVKYGGIVDRIGFGTAAAAFTAISAAVLYVGFKAPDWIAPYVPMSWEAALGDAMIGDFGGRFCNGPGGQEALDALVKRIEPKGSGLQVRVANINMVNAVALPGGRIVIFRGLLQEAKSPDELAGVIGHEIGHVRNRDVMQSLLRQLGLSVLLGGFGGDASGYVGSLVSATYSREAETKADGFSINLMKQANVSPVDTAGFFARLAGGEGADIKGKGKDEASAVSTAIGYLSSHPMSKKREAMFRGSANPKLSYTPAITPQQWRSLVDSCANDPDVKQDDGLFF